MGLHDRLSKQNENGAANVIAERPVALAGPVTTPVAPNAPVITPRAGDPYAELKSLDSSRCDREARSGALQARER